MWIDAHSELTTAALPNPGVQESVVFLTAFGIIEEKLIALSPTARVIVGRRQNRYANQSRSLHVKTIARAVTVIAFVVAGSASDILQIELG